MGRPGRLLVWAAVLAAALVAGGACSSPSRLGEAERAAYARATSRGAALLENREATRAVEAFSEALELVPGAPAALRNLARAQLAAQQVPAALASLERAAAAEEEPSAATAYLTGITLLRLNRAEEAATALEQAKALDGREPAVRFQLANAYQLLERHREAQEQLRETVRLDPYHAAATFKLARYAAAEGRRRDFERWNGEFNRLRELLGEENRSPELLERCRYTAAELVAPMPPAGEGEQEAPQTVRFSDATEELFGGETPTFTAAAVLEVGGDGARTLAAVDASGRLVRFVGRQGRLERLPGLVELAPPVTALAAGDYFDVVPEGESYDAALHARNDLVALTADGLRLLRQQGDGELVDVTAAAGLAGVEAAVARWVDLEHDGDLDLVTAGDAGLGLWRNRGDGTFEAVGEGVEAPYGAAEPALSDEPEPAAQPGAGAAIPTPALPLADVAAADLDGDVAIDLVVAPVDAEPVLLRGRREGRFSPAPAAAEPWPTSRFVLLDDLDGDGAVDAVLVGESAVAFRGPRRAQPELALGDFSPRAAALVDYDNDGRLDLALAGTSPRGSSLRLWRNEASGWREVGGEIGLAAFEPPAAGGLLAADLDADGDSDLLLTTADGTAARLLRNDGGDANAQLTVRLVGTKSNPTALGTQVEARAGSFRAVRQVSALPVEIGLGPRRQLDAVRTLWANGVVDNEIDVEVGEAPLTVVEENVATGSCPFLYAWDGDGWRFVTDLLGNAPVGLPLARGVMLDADPDELVEIGGAGALAPRDGAYALTVTSEFREVLYLDTARLVAVDHPPEVEIHPTDKLMPAPFPPSELWALGKRRPLRSAVADGGADPTDLTDLVSEADGRFAPPGRPLPPPLRGQVEPRRLSLDFGPLPAGRPLVLALTGWLQYGDASTNIALSQSAARPVVAPALEVEAAGGWQPVPVVVGMPAGKTKTILVDLSGRLPEGARRLRLTTSFEIRWDRVALFERLPDATRVVHQAGAGAAELAFRGFSELRSRAPDHPTTPELAAVSPRPPWRTALAGWSTRYGDVLELVAERDGLLAVVNSGDAVALEFPAAAFPPPAPGRERSWFFYSVGWDKDGDHNVAGGDTVGPLPAAPDDPAAAEIQRRYDRRWVPYHRFGDGR